MAFVSGLFLIDAPASALNNLGKIEGSMTDNASGVKYIRTKEGAFPYVSAQSFRYWLRTTLQKHSPEWRAAPVYREEKIAYTDANPIRWWDDDLFGYMRAPSKKESAAKSREADPSRAGETPTEETVTRVSPFRVSTLISISPVSLVNDFGVMSRQEGDPVPHEHQFYRTTMVGQYSLDLDASGSFSYRDKTGYLNLDEVRQKEAIEQNLERVEGEKSYRLQFEKRIERIGALLKAFSVVDGGAKQAIHYTDVSPDLIFSAVVKGGNSLFGHIIGSNNGKPEIKTDALSETLTVFDQEIISKVYVGWVPGYLDNERARFVEVLEKHDVLKNWKNRIVINHPRNVMAQLTDELKANPAWLD